MKYAALELVKNTISKRWLGPYKIGKPYARITDVHGNIQIKKRNFVPFFLLPKDDESFRWITDTKREIKG